MEITTAILAVGLLVFLAHLFTGIFSRTRIPDVLLLMLIGLAIGPFLHLVTPEEFGALGPLFTSITLIVILFQGGLDLKLDVLYRSLRGSVFLTVTNFVITMIAVGLLSMIMAGMDVLSAFTLGAILGGTSSAVVIPMVRQLSMKEESKTVLLLESALSDVLCIVVAIALMESLKYGMFDPAQISGKIIASFTIASLLGAVGALGWSLLLNKIRALDNSIFLTPAFVFVVYGIVEVLGFSGAIAALAFGIVLGNADFFSRLLAITRIRILPVSLNSTEKIFFSEVVFLLKTFFFVYIGLSIIVSNVALMVMGLILTLIIFYVRIPTVWISLPRKTPVADASISAVMVPKGLAAAVLASIPLQMGLASGELIQCITYAVILFSIVLNSILVFLLEKTSVARFYGWMFSDFGRDKKEPEGDLQVNVA
ncbi:cation:proton antiporter [Methanocella arvoryzae]|uniref:Na(+)/H(+) antiporter n=1 Tax=Methanocella arvoryzae (strain DSM 22066 / NBRC 105507 / MRE50) TaxID=351160 RepID=Q0W0D7_METAR|nr:cation:proton antiporter [Methanocella arvoryzae]CAJ38156.1 putative Na(+)/H(+) antiporter [Methanocella arvoryzae MRE50]